MALARATTHTTPADGTFSTTGATEWNRVHTMAITGAISGGIPYFDSTTTEATSALLVGAAHILGGGAGNPPISSTILKELGSNTISSASFYSGGTTLANSGSKLGTNGITSWRDGLIGFATSNANIDGGLDTALSRISAGLIGVGTGASGSFAGSLKVTDIFTNNAVALVRTTTTLTDQAGASAGTLGNAPAIGNPTKWIAIDDNGTTRKIPTWT